MGIVGGANPSLPTEAITALSPVIFFASNLRGFKLSREKFNGVVGRSAPHNTIEFFPA
jgi:hypothetical protein